MTMPKSTWEVSKEWWDEVKRKVNHAVVFMDAKMAELLHWSGSVDVLLSSGAVDVREFSSFEGCSEQHKKSVFMVSSPLSGVTENIIRDVVSQSSFQYVVVMTTVSPLLQAASEEEAEEVFGQFEEKVLEWMGNMNYTVEIMHIPIFAAEVCPGFFITPTFSSLFPLLPYDVKQIAHQYSSGSGHKDSKVLQTLKDVDITHLPDGLQMQIKSLSSGLHALLQGLDVREDIYSVGDTSRIVATQLDSYSPAKARRKAVQERASLVLFDRSLDLASAVTHQMDTLMDKMTNTLPALPDHHNDRLVDMQALSNTYRQSTANSVVLPGSLAPTNAHSEPRHLMPLFNKKQKEALMEINRKLVETASAEKLPIDLSARPGRVTADQLDNTLALFKGKYSLIRQHLDTLQVAMATSQTLHDRSIKSGGRQDSVSAAEKNLIQTMAEEDGVSPSGLSAVAKLILQESGKPEEERILTLDDVICLLAFAFSLTNGDCGDEDEAKDIREHLARWIKEEEEELPPITKDIVGEKVSESILWDQLENLWDRLVAVGEARDEMKQFRSVLDPGDAMTPARQRPLVAQIVEKIVDPAKPEIPDVECKSGGLKDLLKSGFGLFKSTSKPRPGDASLLILFVIGGMTSGEVKLVRDIVDKAKPPFEILIGSTRISSIASTLKSALVEDNINLDVL